MKSEEGAQVKTKSLVEQAKELRTTCFGLGSLMNIVCVKPPRTVEECGLYIHVEDIPKFLEWQKQMEKAEGGKQICT